MHPATACTAGTSKARPESARGPRIAFPPSPGGFAGGEARMSGYPLYGLCCLFLCLTLLLPTARAQTVNPVYLDDSTRTRDAIAAIPSIIAAGNMAEAIRTLQDLLDTEGARVIETPADADLFIDVRERVTAFILADPAVLAAYRDVQEPEARRLVTAGLLEEAERTRWATRSGLEASLRLAQREIEHARFESARLALGRGERHPDITDPQLAAAAADLATLVCAYLPRPEVYALASRLCERLGRRFEPPRPAEWPADALSIGLSPTTAQPSIAAASLDHRAQHAVRLAPESARPDDQPPANPGRERIELPWVMPTVVGDLVLVNDGEYLSAWDRFTLAMRWRIRPPNTSATQEEGPYTAGINYRQSLGQSLEDASFITPAGPLALAVTGLARNGVREGDPRLHAVEIGTGRLVWSVAVEGLDPLLAAGSLRGPPLIDADTVVVCVRTFVQFKRLQSAAMVGLDLYTGQARWVRPLASAGTLPYRRPTAVADLGVAHQGVIYRVDELGTISALEAASGRTVWIRRMLSISGPPENGEPWAMSGPLLVGDHLIVLTPDHRDILRLDRHTGAILGRRGADVFGWPRYILAVGNSLAAVGIQRIAFASLATFETDTVRGTPLLPPPSVGRAVVAGNTILAPIGGGLAIIDPSNASRPFDAANTISLTRRGMIVAAPSQLLIADNERLRSFLVWPEALERLKAQVEARPDDPVPALTLARLALRASEWRLLTPSLDRALDILDRLGPLSPVAGLRDDVFGFTLDTIRQARLTTPGEELNAANPIAPPDVAAALLNTLTRAARRPEQNLAHLMERALAEEAGHQHAEAAATYQKILAEPVLAGAMWSQGVRSTRGQLEATDRLQQLIAARGTQVYEAFEQSARRERDVLGSPATLADLAALASRYPMATTTPALWLEIARGLQAQARPVEALDAISHAERAAGALALAGTLPEGSALPESIGLLLTCLSALGQPEWGVATLDRILSAFPAIAPTANSTPVDLVALRAHLLERAAIVPRLPAIGGEIRPEPVHITARAPLRPLLGDEPHDAVLLLAAGSARLELWSVTADGLSVAWERELATAQLPSLLSIDDDRILLFIPADMGPASTTGPTIECLRRADGSHLWRTPGFGTLFAPDPDLQARFMAGQSQGATIITPLDGAVRLDDLLATHDSHTLVLSERSGRTAAFDMTTGEPLWAAHLPLAQVHDVAVKANRLAVGGAFLHPVGPDSVQTTLGPVLLLLDSRTGDVLARHDDATAPDDPRALGEVRWVKITPDARLIAGLRIGIGAFSLDNAQDLWRSQGPATGSTLDAWIDEDRLWILGADRGLRQLSLDTGQLQAGALPTQGRTGSRRPVRLTRLQSRIIITSGKGVVLLDREGGLLGVDAIDRQDTLLAPAVGSPLIALLDTSNRRGTPAGSNRLTLVNTTSAREIFSVDLLLGQAPEQVILLDHHILISTPGGITVLPAPAD